MKWNQVETGGYENVRWDEELDILPLSSFTQPERIRMIGVPFIVRRHWCKEVIQGRVVKKLPPITCPALDPDKNTKVKDVNCLACEVMYTAPQSKQAKAFKKAALDTDVKLYSKAIIRSLQRQGKPFIRNLCVPTIIHRFLINVQKMVIGDIASRYGNKVASDFNNDYNPAHSKLGFDITVQYNGPNRNPTDTYTLSYNLITPLTPQEVKIIGNNHSIPSSVIQFTSPEVIAERVYQVKLDRLLPPELRNPQSQQQQSRQPQGMYNQPLPENNTSGSYADYNNDDAFGAGGYPQQGSNNSYPQQPRQQRQPRQQYQDNSYQPNDGSINYETLDFTTLEQMKGNQVKQILEEMELLPLPENVKDINAAKNYIAEALDLPLTSESNGVPQQQEEKPSIDLMKMDRNQLLAFIEQNNLPIDRPKIKPKNVLIPLIKEAMGNGGGNGDSAPSNDFYGGDDMGADNNYGNDYSGGGDDGYYGDHSDGPANEEDPYAFQEGGGNDSDFLVQPDQANYSQDDDELGFLNDDIPF